MKFTCEKHALQDAIGTAQKAVTGKSTTPILEGLLLIAKDNQITIVGSDKDLSIETKITANIIKEGKVVVDSRLFGEIIRKMPNDEIHITIDEDNDTLQIVCQKSNAALIYMNGDEYPNLPTINENIVFSVPQAILKNMIKGTLFSVAQDELRPILTGVLFEVKDKILNFVALDGQRLALRYENINNENDVNVVIPGKTLSEVSKILGDSNNNADITFTSNHILFDLGDTKVISRLLEGEFIKYNSIIPNEYNLKVVTKRTELLDSIERASLMAKESNTNPIKLDIQEDIIVITSDSQLGKAREELNVIMQGQPLKIAFNSKYLIDVLKILEEEEIVMEFSSSVSPCVIKNKEKNNCTYLVLPVRFLN